MKYHAGDGSVEQKTVDVYQNFVCPDERGRILQAIVQYYREVKREWLALQVLPTAVRQSIFRGAGHHCLFLGVLDCTFAWCLRVPSRMLPNHSTCFPMPSPCNRMLRLTFESVIASRLRVVMK